MNNVLTYMTGMLYNMVKLTNKLNMLNIFKKYILVILLLIGVASCSGKGFYSPITMELEVPEGPQEFKAGWHNGCQSGMSMKYFANQAVYDINFGNGVYQHDPVYQSAWRAGSFSCRLHGANFPKHASWKPNDGNGKWGALR